MNVRVIQERLDAYQAKSLQEEEHAIREIAQEIALVGLARAQFFKVAAFHGGSCLRVLHSLDRFSEDLDFALLAPNPDFGWGTYLQSVQREFEFFGLAISLDDRSRADRNVRKAFLKDDSMGQVLSFTHHSRAAQRPKKIRIKVEVDTHPPTGARYQTHHLDFPLPAVISAMDLPSLFSGKCHALLSRAYLRGRDWYDFLWYTARRTPVNYHLLTQAFRQDHPETGTLDKAWLLDQLEQKINDLNWEEARQDVARFLHPHEQDTLTLWTRDFFLERLRKMGSYL